VVPWLQYALQNPLGFYASMWATSLHSDILHEQPSLNDVERIFFKAETIRLLHEDLCKPSTHIGEPQLFAIFLLATHDSFSFVEKGPELFPAPLTMLSWLSIYWRMGISEMHFKALFTVVDFIGGIDKIQFPGLAEICS
jgi:hypothetical protein